MGFSCSCIFAKDREGDDWNDWTLCRAVLFLVALGLAWLEFRSSSAKWVRISGHWT